VALGSNVLDEALRQFSDDPYEQFRNAKYSNDGLLSEKEELKLGKEIHTEVGKKYKIVSDGQPRAERLGQRVARTCLRANLDYHFYIVRSKEINAFSTPGGNIYITTALMDLASDDELGGVLAHEIGHVVGRHSLKTMQQSEAIGGLADAIGSITGIVGDTGKELGKAAAKIVASPLLMAHSREEEREADFLGVHNMTKAGFDNQGMVTMFQKLLKLSKGGSTLLGTLFSDHPDAAERIRNTRYEIDRMKKKG
jgi:predicted Zn-dependent protease